MDDQEKESSLKPISEGVQEILEDQTAELKALGIYASFQPVNLGKGGEDNVNLDTLYYHTGMFSDALLDKLKMEFPNEKLKDEFKECVLFDIHSSITTEQGALVTPYEAYIAQNYTNDMEELLRLSREAEKCLSDLAWDACNDVLDSIYRLQQEYKEDRQRPSYQIDMVTEVFNEEEPQYFNTKEDAQDFVKDMLQDFLQDVGEDPSTFIDQDGLTFQECIEKLSFNLGSETLTTIELPPGYVPKKDEPERIGAPGVVGSKTNPGQLITLPDLSCRNVSKDKISGYIKKGIVTDLTDYAKRSFSKEQIQKGFVLNYTNMYQKKDAALFVPNPDNRKEWIVSAIGDHGWKKTGTMNKISGNDLNIIQAAAGEAKQYTR